MDAMTFSAIQAEDGTMLFGGNGLISFDGARWEKTPLPSGYAVRGLDFGADGKLWMGAYGELGWYERTASLGWKLHSLVAHLPAMTPALGQVWRVFAEPGGAIFVCEDRILRWNGREFSVWMMPGTRRLLATRVGDEVLIHYVGHGLYRMKPHGPEIFIPGEALQDIGGVAWLARRSDREWLLVTERGLFLFADNQVRPFAPDVSEYLRPNAVASVCQLADGRCAISTYRGGVVIVSADGRLDQIWTEAEGLPTKSGGVMFVDGEGSLWMMSRAHIARVAPSSPTAMFDLRSGLPERAYRSIARHGAELFVGAENGIFRLDGERSRFEPVPKLAEIVHAMFPTRDGLLFGTVRGAKRLRGDVVDTPHVTTSDVLAFASSRRSPGIVYAADGHTVVALNPPAPARVVVRDLPDYARSIAEDDAGNLWIATIARGVLHATPDPAVAVKPTAPPGRHGLPALTGRSLVQDTKEGAVLVFSSNAGWFKPAGAVQFQPIKNYPARVAYAASEVDANGHCWIAHEGADNLPACIARVAITNGEARWEPHAVPGLAEIGPPRAVFAERESDGSTTLWIGGTKSVLRNRIARGPVAPRPRPPLLRVFAQQEETAERRLVAGALPFSTPGVEIELAAPEYAHGGVRRLETWIEGVDTAWRPTDRDGRRSMSAARDGSYVVRARVVAETGATSEPAVFRFEVLPPWWRTTPALVFGFAALAPLGYGAYRLRSRALRRRNAELEDKVRLRTQELEAANAAKTQFVANMSHDIRNPLNGIVGLALGLEDTQLDKRQRELVATLRECSTYLSSLVDDVLDFASIEAGKVELRPRAFAPQELLQSVVTTLKGETAQCGALLLVEADPAIPANLYGDAGRIQQILVNFASNALKYAGGHIRLSVTQPANAPGEIEFAVTDEGPGISAPEQAALFTKFTRLKNNGREHVAGTGLGLAACRLLADIMGGSVGVESAIGHGARFFLRLPLTIAAEPATVPATTLPNSTVLLVEDTDYNAWAATAVLARLGLSCERARNGAEALDMFARQRHNIVLLDRNLPDLDGTEIARRIREMETDGVQSILLAVTAYCTAEDRELCLEAGMNAFVGKPLTPEKLRAALLGERGRLLAAPAAEIRAPQAAAALDLSLLRYLSDGTPDGLDAQVQRHLATLAEANARLEAAVAGAEFDAARTAAHDLEGYARMVGAAKLVAATSQLRGAAQARDAAACARGLAAVAAETRALTAAMRQYRSAAHSA